LWSVNNEQLPGMDAVRQRLAAVASIRTDIPVVVDPDDSIRLGPVIDAYDLAMQQGFENIQFTTK